MWFKVDYRSGKPVYEQIKDNIKDNILSGKIKEGEFLPSIRSFAQLIEVNLNTVSRAYRELENEGLVEASKGVGYAVKKIGTNKIEKEIFSELDKVLERLLRSGTDEEKILNYVKNYFRGEK